MLVVLSGDPRGDDDLVRRVLGFSLCQDVCVHDTSSLDLELNRTSQIKGKVEAVLVVRHGANRRNDEFAIPGDVRLVGAEVGMFVQDARIFLAVVLQSGQDKLACGRLHLLTECTSRS